MIAAMSPVIAMPVVVYDDDRCAGVDRIIGIRVLGRRLARGLWLRVISRRWAWAPIGPRRDMRIGRARIEHVELGQLAHRGMSAALFVGKNPLSGDLAFPHLAWRQLSSWGRRRDSGR
jgi:hypothetical protein